MPYIVSDMRSELNYGIHQVQLAIDRLVAEKPVTRAGMLNYVFTKLVHGSYPESYSDYNEAVGVLECCKLELYRRKVGPYEDQKIKANGDV